MQAGLENRLLTKTSALALAMGAGLGIPGAQAAVIQGVFDPVFFGATATGSLDQKGNPSVDLDFTKPTAPHDPSSRQFSFTELTLHNVPVGPESSIDFATVTTILPEVGNKVLGFTVAADPNDPSVKEGSYAKALGAGAIIGEAGQTFVDGSETQNDDGVIAAKASTNTTEGSQTTGHAGDFCKSGGAFIGLQFDLNGETHYGWVEAESFEDCTIALRRFAYEDVADKPITTPDLLPPLEQVPEPSALALLASGAIGILAIRRRQRQR